MRIKFLVLLFLILCGFTHNIIAQEYEYITDISVAGNINVNAKLIESASGLAPGDIYFSEAIAQAIKNIYKLGLFEKIGINKIDSEKGAKIIIKVVEYPIIQEVLITGNEKFKAADIDTEIKLAKGDYWSGQKRFETRNKILSLYYEKGYRLATVHFDEQQLQINKIGLSILIDEGQKVTVKEIKFSGNIQISNKKLKKEMKTKPNSLFRSGEFNLEKFEEDLQKIEDLYQKKGFIDAVVLNWNREYDDEGNLIIEIEVSEGSRYKIGDVFVEGNFRFDEETILGKLDMKSGEIFNQEGFNKKLNLIHSMYYEDGYIYSAVEQYISRQDDEIDISVKISENTRARIRQIYIKGNTLTKEKVIRRQLAIVPGDYFRQSLLMQSIRNIYNLGFFGPNIEPDYQQINDNGDIDLIFTVEEKSSGSANAGVSFDQTDKLVGFITLSQNNLFGNAWRVALQWEFSGITQNYDISFTNPYLFDTNTLVGFDVYHTKRSWADWNYTVFRTGGGIRLGTMIPWLDYSRITCGYSLTQKEYDYIDMADSISADLQNLVEQGEQLTSTFSLTLQRDGRDNVFRPSEGSLITSYTELAGGPFGGNENYYKEIFQTNWYLNLFWKVVLGMKWRFGYAKAFGETESVPLDERFYPGGTGPDGIRGYTDRTVIPSLNGGNTELICSSELAFPISGDQFIGVLFFDAGNSYNYLSEINIHKLYKGAGIGIRFMTPMGLLGFDYAYGFDKDETNKWQSHFQFGTTF